MARFNEILAGRYNRFLQKFLSMKGGPPAPQLASELSATWALFHGRENRYLEDWRLFGSRTTVGPSAGNDSVSRLRNPVGSTIIAVLESLKFTLNVPGECFIEYSNTPQNDLAAVSSNVNFDRRFNPPDVGNNGSQCVSSTQVNIPQVGLIFDDVSVVASVTSPELITNEEQQIPLLPGSTLQVRSSTLNVALIVTYRWRERPLEDSEKT